MTQKDLAEQANVSTAAVGQYETGARTPNLHVLSEIATVLGVTMVDLVQGTRDEDKFVIKSERVELRVEDDSLVVGLHLAQDIENKLWRKANNEHRQIHELIEDCIKHCVENNNAA